RGNISVSSTPGAGTTFRILLPVANTESTEWTVTTLRDTGTAPVSPASRESLTILLVDDDEGVRTTISRQLMRLGFHVISAPDGFTALDLVERSVSSRADGSPEAIDLVLLDLTMPRMDGAETFEKLHAIAPDLPVVLCSGYSDEELRTRFEGKAIAGYLCKPFEIRALEAAVQGAMARTSLAEKADEELCVLAG
ncbi:MAG TPA: response regulator, partial [Verrucomicrobiales bacterium]|nr:response regulator [Verrucomicrobiales bacterium]